jgi:hypothetical protein
MDFNSMLGYLTSLAMLYAWTLFAAGAFAVGERVCGNLFVRQQPAPGTQDQVKG